MGRRVEDEPPKVVVDEPVVGDPTGLLAAHGAAFPQKPKLVGQGREAHPDDERDVADAQRTIADREKVDDPRAGWVAEGREQLGDLPCALCSQGATQERTDRVRVEAIDLAAVCINR